MSNRVLRDDIWESDRFLDLPTDAARLAFIRFLGMADDYGNFEGGPRHLFRLLQTCTQVKNAEAVGHIMDVLMAEDLVRRYEADGRECFHIPRFRNQRRYWAHKCPGSQWDDKRKPTVEKAREKEQF